jgi:DNA-binding CsgD family transcriptional regulator
MVRLYQQYLTRLLGLSQATWMAAYRGPFGRDVWQTRLMEGWKAIDRIYPEGVNAELTEEAKAYFKQAQQEGNVDPQVSYAISKAGITRVQRLHEAISPEDWSEHWMKSVLASKGVGERMVGAYTLSDIAESYILVDRPPGAAPFSREEADTFYQALIEFPRLHQWLFLERGLIQPAQRPLTPRHKEVLHLLLRSGTEADLAETLKIGKGTVHNYISEIYKNFGVQSRFELIQLWLKNVEPV